MKELLRKHAYGEGSTDKGATRTSQNGQATLSNLDKAAVASHFDHSSVMGESKIAITKLERAAMTASLLATR